MSFEGTPLVGPLPLELQQIKAQTDAAAAAAAALASRRKSEDVKNLERNILKIRRRSFGIETALSPHEDPATRRSSRAIKRKKFDDELSRRGSSGQLTMPSPMPSMTSPIASSSAASLSGTSASSCPPQSPLSGESSRSRNASVCQPDLPGGPPTTPALSLDPNSCLSLPDIRQRKSVSRSDKRAARRRGGGGGSVRREGAIKDLGRWKPADDLLLLSAVEQTKDLAAVVKAVKFSCHFTLAEIQERWYALLYDPVICQLAGQAVRNLPGEAVQRVLARAPFSREEEDVISSCGPRSSAATVSLADFDRLLEAKPAVFHPSRTGRGLLTHWQFLKQYSILAEQTVQPIPRADATQHILNFQAGYPRNYI
jgi:microspherule protein 1